MTHRPRAQQGGGADLGARRLTRSITATWWYTATGVLFLEGMLVLLWTGSSISIAESAAPPIGIGGALWWASTLPLLLEYRNRPVDGPVAAWRTIAPLLIAVAYGCVAGPLLGMWILGVLPLVQSLALLNWPSGIRIRVVLAATTVLAALWTVDTGTGLSEGPNLSWWMTGFYSIGLPAMSVLSLWWWDVLIALNRARVSEARLAATQERLRIATDVHDLQGHHLQVIALQLELAERLMTQDSEGALEQLRAARATVRDAQQGTRDLATRVRAVALEDEVANAVDLLRAAGARVDAHVHSGLEHAPAATLGPVVRETTTNILRHGGGGWVRMSLTRDGRLWRYSISNDARSGEEEGTGSGAGLDGIRRRAASAGGAAEVRRDTRSFTVTVTVPASAEAPS